MKTCGTCKHFSTNPEGVETSHKVGDFHKNRYSAPLNYGVCMRHVQQQINGTQMAVPDDSSGYFAKLICRQDFGCMLHEDKGKPL